MTSELENGVELPAAAPARPTAAPTAARRELQILVHRIEGYWGTEWKGRLPPRTDIKRCWLGIYAYTRECLSIRSPADQAARPVWKLYTDAQAHWLMFQAKVSLDNVWNALFPLDEFGRAWNLARAEFLNEMVARDPGVRGKESVYFLYHAKLYHPADCPLSLDSSNGVETTVTMMKLTNIDQGSFACFTGWSPDPPSDLPALQLNTEATDPTEVRHLQEQAERNTVFFERTVELSRSLRRSMISSPDQP